ncbi:SDR family NAD(P)-dependent oxidoreductase [Cytobacillus oceanisediminis]|uniref:SDR family NAD(P)-dependent oxidoreductase n=1 Tax=Cytobacillus oceanisediminis TaxID=665099 RepID=UPI001C2157BC|nr:SDR family oxidoreductase [Cytobacillus oceanisediminis]MBU8772100.1 SDR family oxidoreductase [Cytobacillus oceanisediminis]
MEKLDHSSKINGKLKQVFITGISQGIGKSIARVLLCSGYQVIGTVRSLDDKQFLEEELNPLGTKQLSIKICDLSFPHEIESLKKSLNNLSIDVLINNAGIGIKKSFDKISLEDWNNTIQTNLTASFLLAQWAFSTMKKANKGGLIIQISSMASVPYADKLDGFVAYTASKYAVAGLIENIAVEGKPYGINSLCISPDAVNTRMLKHMAPELEQKMEPLDIALFVRNMVENFNPYLSGLNIPLRTN